MGCPLYMLSRLKGMEGLSVLGSQLSVREVHRCQFKKEEEPRSPDPVGAVSNCAGFYAQTLHALKPLLSSVLTGTCL